MPQSEAPRRPLAIVGPTASGKSAIALEIARALAPEVEIVSVDSMQVYRGMDIGTAKLTPEERDEIRHHLIDVADPDEDFSVARFQSAAQRALTDIEARGHQALLVGGTGLYLRAITDALDVPGRWPEVKGALEEEADTPALHRRLSELDPVAAARIEPMNRRRVVRALEVTIGSGRRFSSFGPGLDSYPAAPLDLVGIRVPRDELGDRVEKRFHRMIDDGLVDEVNRLRSRPAGLSRTARQALGYREVLAHLEDGIPLDACIAEAIRRTRRFVRRQIAWFVRDPRIVWYDAPGNPLAVVPLVLGDWEQRCRPSS